MVEQVPDSEYSRNEENIQHSQANHSTTTGKGNLSQGNKKEGMGRQKKITSPVAFDDMEQYDERGEIQQPKKKYWRCKQSLTHNDKNKINSEINSPQRNNKDKEGVTTRSASQTLQFDDQRPPSQLFQARKHSLDNDKLDQHVYKMFMSSKDLTLDVRQQIMELQEEKENLQIRYEALDRAYNSDKKKLAQSIEELSYYKDQVNLLTNVAIHNDERIDGVNNRMKKIELRCKSLKWPRVSDGRRPFGASSGGQHMARQPFRPRLKLPTQSQMADDYILKFQFKAKLCELHGCTPVAHILVIHYMHA